MAGAKRRVLFVCIGNACRSQMAEGFARSYGSDVMEVSSAGLAPAAFIPEITLEVMREKGIDLSMQFPKPLTGEEFGQFDLILNLSGMPLPPSPNLREWKVDDPIGESIEVHRRVRDEVEGRVMALVMELRKAQAAPASPSTEKWKRTRPRLLR